MSTRCPPAVCPLVRPEPSLLGAGRATSPRVSLSCSGRTEEPLEGRVQGAKTSAAGTPRPSAATPSPLSPDPPSPAGGALASGPRAPASRGHHRRGPQAPTSSTSRSPRAKQVPEPYLGQGGVWDVGPLASVLPGPSPRQKPQLTRAEGHLPRAGTAAAGNRYGPWGPGLPPSSQRGFSPGPFPAHRPLQSGQEDPWLHRRTPPSPSFTASFCFVLQNYF